MKIENNKYIFFLGGHDAEMLEIRNILSKYNYIFFDNALKWDNANTSSYKNEIINLKENEIPVFIELKIDIQIPTNSKIIDHHFEKEKEPSSIEQIAKLLHIELNRWQQLIAANDKGYIPAMKCLCATEEEIEKVRAFDRNAQGVTEEDERLAEESIKKNQTEENGIITIKSLTEKFSPIADKMFGKTNNLLIFTGDKLTYYGERKEQIVKKFEQLIKEGKAYYGGGENGFFGLAKGKVTPEEVNEIKEQIIKMRSDQNEKIYSHHIFMFPFKWRIWNIDEDNASLKEKFDVTKFRKELESNSPWKRKDFKLDHYDDYNEYNYFYDYVREVLYDFNSNVANSDIDEELINHFEYDIDKCNKYNIKLFAENKTFSLEIDSILLNVYKTGTAVLSFHLRNYNHPDKNDILKINKFGRRIYVPFFDLEPDSIITGNPDETNRDKVLCATKKSEIPDALWIGNPKLAEDDRSLYEDFENYRNKEFFSTGAFALPKFIDGLFPKDFFLVRENDGYLDSEKKKKNPKYKIHLMPVLDDRMHVVCWYGNTKLVNKLNQVKNCSDFDLGNYYINDNREKKNHYPYEESEWWYSYIFVDTSPMHTDKYLKQKLLKEQTYSRWVERGTVYGFSRFSFVMLTSSFSDLEKYGSTFLVRHLQTMYYKMAELCLLQRATVLSFSDEVTHVSNLIDLEKQGNGLEKILNKISDLYKSYILFVNKINFREITAQEQGIEMYDMIQKIMRIQNDVKDLDSEIGELNQFANIIADQKQSNQTTKLTKLAALFVIPTLIASLLGMNVLPGFEKFTDCILSNSFIPFWISMGVITVLTAIGFWSIKKFWLDKKNN